MSEETTRPVPPAPISTRGFGSDPSDLLGQTLRTVALLVGICVLFVGALSAAAVAITSKAVGASPQVTDVHDANRSASKPLSI